MNTHPRLIASVMIASVLLLNMPSPLASGAPNGRNEHDTIVTFTKWVTAVVPPIPAEAAASRFLMAGIVGGDVAGDFVGEVLDRRVSTTGTVTSLSNRLRRKSIAVSIRTSARLSFSRASMVLTLDD